MLPKIRSGIRAQRPRGRVYAWPIRMWFTTRALLFAISHLGVSVKSCGSPFAKNQPVVAVSWLPIGAFSGLGK